MSSALFESSLSSPEYVQSSGYFHHRPSPEPPPSFYCTMGRTSGANRSLIKSVRRRSNVVPPLPLGHPPPPIYHSSDCQVQSKNWNNSYHHQPEARKYDEDHHRYNNVSRLPTDEINNDYCSHQTKDVEVRGLPCRKFISSTIATIACDSHPPPPPHSTQLTSSTESRQQLQNYFSHATSEPEQLGGLLEEVDHHRAPRYFSDTDGLLLMDDNIRRQFYQQQQLPPSPAPMDQIKSSKASLPLIRTDLKFTSQFNQ